jgi:hypothetical protein
MKTMFLMQQFFSNTLKHSAAPGKGDSNTSLIPAAHPAAQQDNFRMEYTYNIALRQ